MPGPWVAESLQAAVVGAWDHRPCSENLPHFEIQDGGRLVRGMLEDLSLSLPTLLFRDNGGSLSLRPLGAVIGWIGDKHDQRRLCCRGHCREMKKQQVIDPKPGESRILP